PRTRRRAPVRPRPRVPRAPPVVADAHPLTPRPRAHAPDRVPPASPVPSLPPRGGTPLPTLRHPAAPRARPAPDRERIPRCPTPPPPAPSTSASTSPTPARTPPRGGPRARRRSASSTPSASSSSSPPPSPACPTSSPSPTPSRPGPAAPGPGGAGAGPRSPPGAPPRPAPRSGGVGLVPTVTTTHTEPFHVSRAIATIDHVSAGRAGWQVGWSTTPAEAAAFGRKAAQDEPDAVAEADEAVEVVTRLWDSWEDDAEIRDVATGRFVDREKLHYVDHEGIRFAVKGPSITPRPPQGQPPVVVRAD